MATDYPANKTNPGKLMKEIIRCVNYAAIKHRDMRRDDEHQSPYINHLIDVAYILVNEGHVADVSIIQAALLHSIIEDTKTSFYELHAEFGEDIACLIKEMTLDKKPSLHERRLLQLELASGASSRAKVVLLAKQLNQLRELRRAPPPGWSREKVQEHFQWAATYVCQLKNSNQPIEASLESLFVERGISIR